MLAHNRIPALGVWLTHGAGMCGATAACFCLLGKLSRCRSVSGPPGFLVMGPGDRMRHNASPVTGAPTDMPARRAARS